MIANSNKQQLHRILIKGGIISPSELSHVIDMTDHLGLDYLHFGSRQDILIPSNEKSKDIEKEFPNLEYEFAENRKHQNIVTSYVAHDIFPSRQWLNGTIYLNILEQFRNRKNIEINITDPLQSFVPLYTGNLNFLAAEEEDYWYLFIKLNGWKSYQLYPVLIYTWDLGKVSFFIEEFCLHSENVNQLFDMVNDKYDSRNNRTISKPLEIDFNPFPYYEGFNKLRSDQYWLGLYWRNNKYQTDFLKGLIELCHVSKIGNICITPWKSIIIKPIPVSKKLIWEKYLGINGINVRHSLLEMNWHIPVNDEFALDLKNYIVSKFNEQDISTYGLTFGIFAEFDTYFTSIVILINKLDSIHNYSYTLLRANNFDPNTLSYITYAQDIDREELPILLLELSKAYFVQLGEHTSVSNTALSYEVESNMDIEMYQCQDCLTVYDQSVNTIPFKSLDEDFKCETCDAGKSNFVKINQSNLLFSQ